ncbi:MAG: TolC family protein [Candidatus Eiseniibacteriota bacterium]|jgi:outer membrane protein TolC
MTTVVAGLVIGAEPGAAQTPLPTEPLSADDCVRIALDRNYQVRLALDAADRATGRSRQAWGGILPSVSSVAQYSYDKAEGPAFGETTILLGESESDTRVLQVRLDQPILDLSSIHGLRSARSSARATEREIGNAEIDVALQVRIRYYEFLKARRLHEVRLESVDLREQQLERAQTLFEVGSVAKNDVLQARVNLQQARLEEIQARNLVALERSRLAQLMGLMVDAEFDTVDNLEMSTGAPLDSVAVMEEALEQRPDLEAARLRLRAGSISLSAARAGRYPSLYSSVQRSWIDQASTSRAGGIELGSSESLTKRWSVTAGVRLSVFDGLLTEGRIKEAKAAEASAEHELRQLELTAALEVKEALLGIREARLSIASASEAVALADENLKLAEERYQLGSGTLLELEEAQVALIEARRSLVEAQAALKVAEARLDSACGRRP